MHAHREAIMRRRHLRRLILSLAAVVLLAACSTKLQPPVSVPDGGGTLHIKAGHYEFEPNNIYIREGDIIVLELENVSTREHTFTLYDPMSNLLRSVLLAPGETVTLWGKGRGYEPGEYWFHCERPFHDYRGEKGRIVVEKR
jgi:plastocyanin